MTPSVWIQFWGRARLEPRLRPGQRLVCADWSRLVVGLLHECRVEGLSAGAGVEALADRFVAMTDGLAVQVLTSATGMRPDRMRSLLLRAFEPDLVL